MIGTNEDEVTPLLGTDSDASAILTSSNSTSSTPDPHYYPLLETPRDLEQHWVGMGVLGVMNILCGVACLCFPILASWAAELTLTLAVLLIGLSNLTAVSFGVQGYYHPYFALGLFQVLTAMIMYSHPFGTLTVLTLLVVTVFMLVASLQISVACYGAYDLPSLSLSANHANANRTSTYMPATTGRGLTMLTGILALTMSMMILVDMPLSSWYTIGLLLGVNLVNIGVNRILLSCHGRSLAQRAFLSTNTDSSSSHESSQLFLPGWLL